MSRGAFTEGPRTKPAQKVKKVQITRPFRSILGAISGPFPPSNRKNVSTGAQMELTNEKKVSGNGCKRQCRIRAKRMPKSFQNDAKIDAKFCEKSIQFGNLRILGFCKEYNVKIVFLHDQGC